MSIDHFNSFYFILFTTHLILCNVLLYKYIKASYHMKKCCMKAYLTWFEMWNFLSCLAFFVRHLYSKRKFPLTQSSLIQNHHFYEEEKKSIYLIVVLCNFQHKNCILYSKKFLSIKIQENRKSRSNQVELRAPSLTNRKKM